MESNRAQRSEQCCEFFYFCTHRARGTSLCLLSHLVFPFSMAKNCEPRRLASLHRRGVRGAGSSADRQPGYHFEAGCVGGGVAAVRCVLLWRSVSAPRRTRVGSVTCVHMYVCVHVFCAYISCILSRFFIFTNTTCE